MSEQPKDNRAELGVGNPETEKNISQGPYLANITDTPRGVNIDISLQNKDFYTPAEKWQPFEPTDEDIEEMEPDDREAFERYDHSLAYHEKMAQIVEDPEALMEQCDILAKELAAAKSFGASSNEARQAFDLLTGLVAKASTEATTGMYASLPDSTKHLVEYAARLVQLYHMYQGSTYTTPMSKVFRAKFKTIYGRFCNRYRKRSSR